MREDYVVVKLSAKGVEVSQGCLVIAGGTYHFTLHPDEQLSVTRAEFDAFLSREERDGEPLFEILETSRGVARNFPEDAAEGT